MSGHFWGKSCSFDLTYALFVMPICSFGCFPFWFRGQDLGSDCVNSRPLLTFSFFQFSTAHVQKLDDALIWFVTLSNREATCLIFIPIMVEIHEALFSCTAVVQALDSMTLNKININFLISS